MNIINKSEHPLPKYGTPQSAGLDLKASLKSIVLLRPLERAAISTGLYASLPKGTVGLVCPRSGLAISQGLTVLNAPGIVDEDYRGEIKVILVNLSNETITIDNGDKIAQLVIVECKQVELQQVDNLNETIRGENGFGHTGIQ